MQGIISNLTFILLSNMNNAFILFLHAVFIFFQISCLIHYKIWIIHYRIQIVTEYSVYTIETGKC